MNELIPKIGIVVLVIGILWLFLKTVKLLVKLMVILIIVFVIWRFFSPVEDFVRNLF